VQRGLQLLFVVRPERGRDSMPLRQLRPLARIADWGDQRQLWQALQQTARGKQAPGPPLPRN
jgi:hypothetical protein